MNRKPVWYPVFIFACTTLLAGCATTVATIRSNPDKYVGKTVTVTGTVGRSISIPFTSYSIYLLGDEENRIAVFSPSVKPPAGRITINARVVGYRGERTVEATRELVEVVSEFLVKHEFAKADAADRVARGIVEAVGRFSDSMEGPYFLLSE